MCIVLYARQTRQNNVELLFMTILYITTNIKVTTTGNWVHIYDLQLQLKNIIEKTLVYVE